jgi:hypothetical protein
MELCDHCRRMIGSETGRAFVGEMVLCHPTEPGELNCFQLVKDHGHQRDCSVCRLAGVVVKR